jgi:hypothetical protein
MFWRARYYIKKTANKGPYAKTKHTLWLLFLLFMFLACGIDSIYFRGLGVIAFTVLIAYWAILAIRKHKSGNY